MQKYLFFGIFLVAGLFWQGGDPVSAQGVKVIPDNIPVIGLSKVTGQWGNTGESLCIREGETFSTTNLGRSICDDSADTASAKPNGYLIRLGAGGSIPGGSVLIRDHFFFAYEIRTREEGGESPFSDDPDFDYLRDYECAPHHVPGPGPILYICHSGSDPGRAEEVTEQVLRFLDVVLQNEPPSSEYSRIKNLDTFEGCFLESEVHPDESQWSISHIVCHYGPSEGGGVVDSGRAGLVPKLCRWKVENEITYSDCLMEDGTRRLLSVTGEES